MAQPLPYGSGCFVLGGVLYRELFFNTVMID